MQACGGVYIIKSWEEISNETVANSMKSCALAFTVDGIEDGLISCFKEGKKCEAGRVLLESLMWLFTDKKLHKDPFKIYPEDMVDAVPLFNIIDEEEDDDIDIDV